MDFTITLYVHTLNFCQSVKIMIMSNTMCCVRRVAFMLSVLLVSAPHLFPLLDLSYLHGWCQYCNKDLRTSSWMMPLVAVPLQNSLR